ncbi:hypothetical protein CKAH01_02933 [Colletotrichum kahawae]|uniref:Hsp70-like protein n=1 Tax=Colletotrichum kahawae TaxID=34407 RepID=A0AAE0DEC3_COLKA|nr:hypothetical protein CKAH01_02933 [Colletotrichum kahawae]
MEFDSTPRGSRELEGHGFRFIISVDYGTTYTGVAWTLTTGRDPKQERIELVDNWQGAVQAKVPSKYTYTACNGTKWGYGMGPEALVLKLTKLKLEPPSLRDALQELKTSLVDAHRLGMNEINNRNTVDVGDDFPHYLTKSPEQIITDYLTNVAKYVRGDIRAKKDPNTLSEFPIDLVITHPAIWHDRAKNITFRAVNKAFRAEFREMELNPGNIRLVTEPEACAQYTMSNVQGVSTLRKGDCFVVVDAGGGTVDLLSYKVEEVSPNFRVLKLTMASDRFVDDGQLLITCCQLYCEGDQWTAVAQGAVLMGLGAGCNVPPAQLQCTVNIGVVLSSNFAKSAHQRSQRYEDTFDGTLRGANEIKWVARKGDLVGPETGITEIVPVRQKFIAGDDGTGRVTVVLSHKDLLPTETHVYQANESALKKFQQVKLDYDLRKMPPGVFRKPPSLRDSVNPDITGQYFVENMHVEIRVSQQQGGQASLFYGAAGEDRLSRGPPLASESFEMPADRE